MSKMTLEQEEVRNQEYNEYVEQMTPKHNLWANMGKAFCWGEVSVCWDRLFYRLQPGYSDLRRGCRSLVQFTSCSSFGDPDEL